MWHWQSFHFVSHEPYQYHFKLSNHGKRVHRMYWKIDTSQPTAKTQKGGSLPNQSFLPPISRGIISPKQRDEPRRGSLLPSSREKSTVSLSPSRLELFPGCSADMVLTVSSDSPKVKLFKKWIISSEFEFHCDRQYVHKLNYTLQYLHVKNVSFWLSSLYVSVWCATLLLVSRAIRKRSCPSRLLVALWLHCSAFPQSSWTSI